MSENELLIAALKYAAAGWKLHPCRLDKTPYLKDWPGKATNDPDRIREWWSKWPDASIGCATGEVSGMWVLDADLPDGPPEIEKMQLPPTLTQKTGGGGFQYFWNSNGTEIRNSARKVGPGLDVRGNGGYVILPPSKHPSGGQYTWIRMQKVADAPEELVQKAAKPPAPERDRTLPGDTTPYGQAALAQEITRLSAAQPGERNAALNQSAYAMGQLIAGGELDEGQARTALLSTALALGLGHQEATKTIESGLKAGFAEPRASATETGETADDKSKKESQAALLVKLCSGIFLFHDRNDNIYAEIRADDGHLEVWSVRSKGFKRWLSGRFYFEHQKPPSSQAMADALLAIEAEGQHRGPELEVYTRIARHDDAIYLNLCNRRWEAVKITAAGWEVVSRSPVKFIRPKGMLELPPPAARGSIKAVYDLLNVKSPTDHHLLVAWMVQAMNPAGPYPVLVLDGPQGSAKTSSTRFLRNIVDPSTAAIRTTPREERDLVIAATNGWICAFDNISTLPKWLSDALCRLSTGTGFSTRTLYTDAEEMIFAASRPVILNGISQVVTRHDLMDRAIFINLEPIPEERRREEKDLLQQFKTAHPEILGALCNAVSAALRNEGKMRFDRLPRMADFARWVAAAEEALPWEKGDFMEAYTRNREMAVDLTLDVDLVGSALLNFMENRDVWEGTPTELLQELSLIIDEKVARTHEWPKTAAALSKRIQRAWTSLFQKGIRAERPARGNERRWHINRLKREKSDGCDGCDGREKTQGLTSDAFADGYNETDGWDKKSTASNILDSLKNDAADGTDGQNPPLSAKEVPLFDGVTWK